MSTRLGAALLAAALVASPACVKTRVITAPCAVAVAAVDGRVDPAQVADAKAKLVAQHGEAQRARIEQGVDQVAAMWRESDGDLVAFAVEQFAATPADVDALFARLEDETEQMDGHALELGRSLRWATEVEDGPQLPVDALLASYDPGAHSVEDLFASKVAFAALLNFPLTTLDQRLADGKDYTRRQWAEVRLTGRFESRVPGAIAAAASAAEADSDQYIAGYNVWMHHVLGEDGARLWPSGKRLISHWNLRDELKADYALPEGRAMQRTIVKVMERIVTQTIPAAVIDNPRLDWNPYTNEVTAAPAGEIEADAPADRATTPDPTPEANVRFEKVLAHFAVARQIDAYAPVAPTRMDRAFTAAEVPEARMRALLESILGSPKVAEVAAEAKRRLGRDLEPLDIWYEFGGGGTPEADLDAITRKKYPTADAFAADLPRIFRDLGFTADKAKFLAGLIEVDPSRGAGHAMEALRRGDKAHLRTRVESGGMDYKGYNIAVHELGHNVEQTFSLYEMDHNLLKGVPNTACTEALAFLFQARDLDLLGRASTDPAAERDRVLDAFWNTFEIAGSALVEMDVWHWLYEHPDATAAQLRDATVERARAIWAKYYAPVLGGDDEPLLGIYSHTISSPLYLFNYVLGHLIAFQVEEHLAGKDKATFASEFERIAKFGAVTPDLWMENATGAPIDSKPLLDATARALSSEK